tara:strand:+ start:168 stop:389 length:222 start_codon:yes stop_codon:yes gene_type:complete
MRTMAVIICLLVLTSFMGVPSHIQPATSETKTETQEDRWKKFDKCRDKFYTHYPDEIIETDWHKCMQRDYTKE